MAELMHQFSYNAASLSVFLFAAAIFLAAFGWACVQFMRMAQIAIATSVNLSRELTAIQQSLARGVIGQPNGAAGIPVSDPVSGQVFSEQPSSAPGVKGKKPKPTEGEFYAYDETLQADLETIRNLRKEKADDQGGLTDEELEAQIAAVQAAGFNENEP